MTKINFSKPIVRDFDGDMSKKWHIYYREWNPMLGRMETMRDYAGLHRIKDLERRHEAAAEKCKDIHGRLQRKWCSFSGEQVESNLAYFPQRKIFKSYVSANSVEAVASEYLKNVKMTESMRPEFVSKIRQFSAWLKLKRLNDKQIAFIDNATVITFFQFLIDELELSGNTIKKYRQTLLSLWDYAFEKRYVIANVITNIPTCNRINDTAAKPIRKDDLKKMWEVIERDPQLELACKLELFCLLRPGREIRFLKVGMIDFTASVIHLPADIVKNTNPNRKRSKTVTVPDQLLTEMIEKYHLNSYPKDFYVCGKFGVPGLEHLGKNTLRTRFRNIREFLKLPEWYKLYSFKHTGVVALMEMNFHPNEIAQQAGWSSTYMMDVYTRGREVTANKNIQKNFNFL